ncbi:MAG: ABC transporter ATP-binding protein [Candidatus Poribacteria bacterium]|nr:ABC transporter ATP-binding protein [Candidatus Poribacteria bacterium]
MNGFAAEGIQLKKRYERGSETVRALDGVDIQLQEGTVTALAGPSGSGKSTLLNLIACLDSPSEGELWINGRNVANASERELTAIRRNTIGFIFQRFHLIPTLTAEENALLPTLFSRQKTDRKRVDETFERVGMSGKRNLPASQLNSGDRQRVAIARAVVNAPKILIADEPTGSLETSMRDVVGDLFKELAQDGIAVLAATHDLELADVCDQTLYLENGQLASKEESSLFKGEALATAAVDS